jgi:hypothetical protein
LVANANGFNKEHLLFRSKINSRPGEVLVTAGRFEGYYS